MEYIIIKGFENGLKWLSRHQTTTNLIHGRDWLEKKGFSVIARLDERHSAIWKSKAGFVIEEPFDPCGDETERMWSCRFVNGDNNAVLGSTPESALVNCVLSRNVEQTI